MTRAVVAGPMDIGLVLKTPVMASLGGRKSLVGGRSWGRTPMIGKVLKDFVAF